MTTQEDRAARIKARFLRKPSLFVEWAFGVKPRPHQAEALDALSSENPRGRVTLRTYRGGGKTALEAWFAIVFAMLHRDALVIVLSATLLQLQEVLFAEIRYWLEVAARRGFTFGDPPLRRSWEPAPGCRVIGVSPRDPGKIQGFHARDGGAIATICDEPASVRDEIWKATAGYDQGAKICQRLAAGIPGINEGWYFDACHSPLWHDVRVSGEGDPTCDERWLEERRAEWGVDSILYQAEVLAEFYSSSAVGLCRPEWIRTARGGGEDVDATGPVEIGADFGDGGDLSAFVARRGGAILDAETHDLADTMPTTGKLKQFCDKYSADLVRGDAVGLGKGPCDRLAEQGYNVERYNGGTPARDRERFRNRRAEDFWGLRSRLEEGRADWRALPDPFFRKLSAQLTSLRWAPNSSGQVQIEAKKEYKTRTKRGSPDEADAVNYAYAASGLPPKPRGIASATPMPKR